MILGLMGVCVLLVSILYSCLIVASRYDDAVERERRRKWEKEK